MALGVILLGGLVLIAEVGRLYQLIVVVARAEPEKQGQAGKETHGAKKECHGTNDAFEVLRRQN